MTSDTYDDFDDRADLATADETIRRLKAENERLRAENADLVGRLQRFRVAIEALRGGDDDDLH